MLFTLQDGGGFVNPHFRCTAAPASAKSNTIRNILSWFDFLYSFLPVFQRKPDNERPPAAAQNRRFASFPLSPDDAARHAAKLVSTGANFLLISVPFPSILLTAFVRYAILVKVRRPRGGPL